MWKSLFKKHSKFQKFDEIYCRMTRFWNVKLDVFRQYQNTKTIFKREKCQTQFQKFQLSNFTLTWSIEREK